MLPMVCKILLSVLFIFLCLGTAVIIRGLCVDIMLNLLLFAKFLCSFMYLARPPYK